MPDKTLGLTLISGIWIPSSSKNKNKKKRCQSWTPSEKTPGLAVVHEKALFSECSVSQNKCVLKL